MDIKKRFHNIREFLKGHQGFWYEEILNDYPHTLDNYPDKWIEDLNLLSFEDLWKIDAKIDFSPLEGELKTLILKINSLSIIPQVEGANENLPHKALLGMNQKKVHEVSRLAPYIGKLQKIHRFSQGFDIGGGKGHLARTLAHYFALPTICLDPDLDLIKAGQKLLKKISTPENAKEISFINKSLGTHIYNPDIVADENKLKLDNETLAIGLHTCGPLSLRLMERAKNLINIGCCYLKLNPESEINISKTSKEDPLTFSKYSLALASRGHGGISFIDFMNKWKVKSFRYSLHLLLYEKLGIKKFITVEGYPLKKYGEDFSEYALTKLSELNIKHSFDAADLNNFHQEWNPLVKKMFLANIIRWQFGRLLEVYILLDRAIYLQENGFSVEINEIFNESISPRNIAILALNN
ncbi:MAG: hypothetical protein DRQ89_01325 [Epsilonproteobacteria bacterium]|nr:MAG: hypothetical protein DRQ89_01325 [Campylobacterota bacterium]